MQNAFEDESRKLKALFASVKHSKAVERNSFQNALKASSAQMSKKLNDRANLKQESYKEKSPLQNEDFENLLEGNSFDVLIILSKYCQNTKTIKIAYTF